MKQLREALILTGARVIDLLWVPTDEGYTMVLKVKGPMTTGLADTLRCRNQVYNLNDNPYPSIKSLSLDHDISSCEVAGPNLLLQPTMVTGFVIKPSEAAEADGELEVHFRAKFSSGEKELWALAKRVHKNPFDLAITALQQSLFDGEPSTEDVGGTRVAMSDGEPVIDAEAFGASHYDEAEDDAVAEPIKRGRKKAAIAN